jgi:hypothetical protein
MDECANPFETLKNILQHARNPEALDDHPWVRSLIVQEALTENPPLRDVRPGQQLVEAIACLFSQLQPANPPRHGKRLDPRWGEFGLLAALYFTPFNHGTPFPTSFLEAWRRIDQAILYFVYGKPIEALNEADIRRYQLVGSDLEYASASTLSDWHKKGLQRFAEIILNRERFLARTHAKPSILLEPERFESPASTAVREPRQRTRFGRLFWLALTLSVILAIGFASLKTWKIYQSGMLVYQDVTRLQEIMKRPLGIETIAIANPRLVTLQRDLSSFKQEARPILWFGPRLAWVPVYGNDLASAEASIELAEHLLNTSLLSMEAAQPLLNEFDSASSTLKPGDAVALLLQAQPQLAEARRELAAAVAAREKIDAEGLSPRLQNLLIGDIDPLLKLADDGLSLGMALPNVLGAGSGGPKTYLLLVENEDELRATGGFITSVGNLVVHNGQVISLDFESVDSEVQEDWSKPYPAAPWQLQDYMNSRVLILRDSNWFTDFPTSALWAEYLYAYTHDHSVDGVIAFDQHFLVMLLGAIGPLKVEGAPYPLTHTNVIEYMRQAKIPPEGTDTIGWYRKEFIRTIAAALLEKLTNGENRDWRALARLLTQALTERHLLLQFDDSVVTSLLAQRGWDNALRADGGDFVMVTDTNIGFNKTSAVVEVRLTYDVDLSDIAAPTGTLTVNHKNNAGGDIPCIQWNTNIDQTLTDRMYPIDRCYWSYLRVYRPAEVELLSATPHAVPGGQMLLGQYVPARVDDIDEELAGIRGFGTLLVVPAGESLTTSFQFALPGTLLSSQGTPRKLTYRLHVQKQPGTLAVPLTVRIHLPSRATLEAPQDAILQGQNLLLNTNLQTDVKLEVVFTVP